MRRVPWLPIYVGLVLVFLFTPVVVVVLFSFNNSAALAFPFRGFSLQWYRVLVGDSNALDAIRHSLQIALVTALVDGVVGTMAAIALVRYPFRGSRVLTVVIIAPVALPGLFIGIALLTFYLRMHIPLSLWTATLGHIIYTLPFVFLVVVARLNQSDPLLEEAARDLGAGPWMTFRRVTLPLIAPAVVGGMLVAVVLSWDEFFITNFTIGPQNTLPLLIWTKIRQSIDPSVNAISTILLGATIIMILVAVRFGHGVIEERK